MRENTPNIPFMGVQDVPVLFTRLAVIVSYFGVSLLTAACAATVLLWTLQVFAGFHDAAVWCG